MNIYKDMLLPIVCIIVGSLLTYFIQFSLKEQEVDKERENKIEDLKNSLNKNVNLLYFYLKTLAYLRVDTQYQEYQYLNLEDTISKNKAHEESYNNYKYISEVQNNIANSYASLYSDYVKLYSITNNYNNYIAIFITLRKDLMALEHSPIIDTNNESQVQLIIVDLTNKYFKKLDEIEKFCLSL